MDKTEQERSIIVKKNNAIIRQTRYDLTLQEQKVLLYIIAQIRTDDEDLKRYEISLNTLCKLLGISTQSGMNYQYLKHTLQELNKKNFWIKDGGISHLINWVIEVSIDEERGIISTRLDSRLKPYLIQLKDNFTLYQIYNILAMRSKYSIRLYEIFKSYAYIGTARFTFDELKELTDTKDIYPLYGNFKQKVITPALAEINDFTDLHITYKPIRKSNHLQYILFDIQKAETEQLILPLDEYINAILSEPKRRTKKKGDNQDNG